MMNYYNYIISLFCTAISLRISLQKLLKLLLMQMWKLAVKSVQNLMNH